MMMVVGHRTEVLVDEEDKAEVGATKEECRLESAKKAVTRL